MPSPIDPDEPIVAGLGLGEHASELSLRNEVHGQLGGLARHTQDLHGVDEPIQVCDRRVQGGEVGLGW